MSETPAQRNRRIFEEATAAGEPVFVVRAKDFHGPEAIVAYGRIVQANHGLPLEAVDLERVEEMQQALWSLFLDFAGWQASHRGQVKRPDVRP
jgi:hypothetical protein